MAPVADMPAPLRDIFSAEWWLAMLVFFALFVVAAMALAFRESQARVYAAHDAAQRDPESMNELPRSLRELAKHARYKDWWESDTQMVIDAADEIECLRAEVAIKDRVLRAIQGVDAAVGVALADYGFNQTLYADLLALAYQYRDDLLYPPPGDSVERRIARAKFVIDRAEGKA